MIRQTQAEANAFWAEHDYKKWVVEFTTGGRRNRRTAVSYVGATTAPGAQRAALADMDLRGHAWAKSAAATVRLATAQDLGCVAVGGNHG